VRIWQPNVMLLSPGKRRTSACVVILVILVCMPSAAAVSAARASKWGSEKSRRSVTAASGGSSSSSGVGSASSGWRSASSNGRPGYGAETSDEEESDVENTTPDDECATPDEEGGHDEHGPRTTASSSSSGRGSASSGSAGRSVPGETGAVCRSAASRYTADHDASSGSRGSTEGEGAVQGGQAITFDWYPEFGRARVIHFEGPSLSKARVFQLWTFFCGLVDAKCLFSGFLVCGSSFWHLVTEKVLPKTCSRI